MPLKKRIAFYGGTFDPIHAGHLAVAHRLTELFALDEVVFVPAAIAPHKRAAPPASGWHRYAMLALATQHEARFRISTIELDQPERPYTVETLARLRDETDSATRLFFIMGADSWSEIRTWREWKRVLTMIDHIVVARPNYSLSAEHISEQIQERIVDVQGWSASRISEALRENGETKIYLTDAVMIDIAATMVRHRRSREERDFDELISPEVANYIRKYKLYGKEHEERFLDAEIARNPSH